MNRLMAVMMFAALAGCGGTLDESGAGATPGDSSIPMEYAKRSGGSTTTTTATSLKSTSDASMSASCATWSTSFPIFTTSAVYFAFDIKATSGHHTERLYLYNQRGALYQEIQVAFASGVKPYTNEQTAQSLGGGLYRVWASLPVSGTAIDTGMMSGTWSAKSFLDSAKSANATESFDLN